MEVMTAKGNGGKVEHADGKRIGVEVTGRKTHTGHPIATATAANFVSPRPNPSAAYIRGAKSEKPKPATERRKEIAARATR